MEINFQLFLDIIFKYDQMLWYKESIVCNTANIIKINADYSNSYIDRFLYLDVKPVGNTKTSLSNVDTNNEMCLLDLITFIVLETDNGN